MGYEFKTKTKDECTSLSNSKSFNKQITRHALIQAGLDVVKDLDKGSCTTTCARRRMESTARNLNTKTTTTSKAVVKGLTAKQAQKLVANEKALSTAQITTLLTSAIASDTSLPKITVSGVKAVATKAEEVEEETNRKIVVSYKYQMDKSASCALIEKSKKFHTSISGTTASWTGGSTADCESKTACAKRRRLAAGARRLTKVKVTTTSTQSKLTDLQAKAGKANVEDMSKLKIETALTTAKKSDTDLNGVVISDVQTITTAVGRTSDVSSSTGASLALSVLMMCALASATQLP